ncbi:3-phosphoshikimate 1-carboxyvinyltransferase [Deinococcus yavapaiensis]|nr:3-phosphoshikimate 1-carboxyvinyltransferase [Deinococcus yavapaiensis]
MHCMHAPFDLRVFPAARLSGDVTAQPSKNYTTRFLLAAALCEGDTLVRRPATSDDAAALKDGLTTLGATLTPHQDGLLVRGFGAHPKSGTTVDPRNAGAVARFLIGVAALTTETTFVTSHTESLGKRPQGDLFDALRSLGVVVESERGTLPVTLRGPSSGGAVHVSAEKSSQYASALMFLAPLLKGGLTLHLTGDIKSFAPLRQTLHTLSVFGVAFEASDDLRTVTIPGPQAYRGGDVTVPGDYPGSSALLVAGTLVPGEIRVHGLDPNDLQGERASIDVLKAMGADVVHEGTTVTVRGGRPLKAVTRDGDTFTDAVQALSAAAAFASGTTTWENVLTLRFKECDRISDTRRELEKFGLHVTETRDSLSITGASEVPGGFTVNGHGDHRMIMMLTLIGLRASKPIVITGAQHIAKSYPDFFDHLGELGATFETLVPA